MLIVFACKKKFLSMRWSNLHPPQMNVFVFLYNKKKKIKKKHFNHSNLKILPTLHWLTAKLCFIFFLFWFHFLNLMRVYLLAKKKSNQNIRLNQFITQMSNIFLSNQLILCDQFSPPQDKRNEMKRNAIINSENGRLS